MSFNIDNLKKDSIGSFIFYHPKDGFLPTGDSFHLVNFIDTIDNYSKVLDLGTGSLNIPIMLLDKFNVTSVDCVEHPEGTVELAKLNVECNNLEEKVRVHSADYSDLSFLEKSSFDVVVSNPPYLKLGSGRESSDTKKNIAKMEIFCDFRGLVKSVSYALKKNGKFYLVFTTERFSEALTVIRDEGFDIGRIDFNPSSGSVESKIFCIEAIKL